MDLRTLAVGDTIELRDGSTHGVEAINWRTDGWLDITTVTERVAGGGALNFLWGHRTDGSVSPLGSYPMPGDIVAVHATAKE